MKTIKYILLATIALVAFSCSDNYLDLYPKDKISSKSFYKTENDFKMAINGAYNPLRVVGPDYFMGETRSDNTHYEFFSNNRGTAYLERESIADFQDNSDNSYVKQIFTNCYTTISRANAILDYLEVNTVVSDDARKYIKGQASFLRAFCYFKLVRYYGGVPLHLKFVEDDVNDAFLPRSSVDSVYNQIIEDAKVAMNNLAAPAKFPYDGLANKGSAVMLLADVYMTLKNYKEAESYLIQLEPMGYDLLTEYKDVFSTANKNSKESIFEIQFLQGLQDGMQSNFIYVFLPRSTNTRTITGVATNNSGTGGWNTPTKNLINDYEPNDKRLDASIGVAEGTYNASSYMAISAYKSIVNYQTPADKVGVPFIKKYLNPHVDPNNTNDNWPVYRFADALLLLAEAQNELDRPDEALKTLERVRTRAGLTTPTTSPGKDALRDMILHERRIELAFENHRWFDLVRTGKAIGVMTEYGKEIKKEHSYLSADSYKIEEYRLIYPLPRSEVERNHLIEQNPKY